MKRRLFAIAMVFVMALSLMPVTALAEEVPNEIDLVQSETELPKQDDAVQPDVELPEIEQPEVEPPVEQPKEEWTVEEQIAALIEALPAPEDVDSEDEEAMAALETQLEALLDLVTENEVELDDEQLMLVLALQELVTGQTAQPLEDLAANAIYVSETIGNDETGNGTQEKPYATLAKAVDKAKTGDTIYVMSDLNMTECARYYNKKLTITSYDDPETTEQETYTITRGENFSAQSDNARSWYNPAMIEVQVSNGTSASLTIKNLTLDDNYSHKGAVFAQAINKNKDEEWIFPSGIVDGNKHYVQDGMVASNAPNAIITLDQGTVLKNFGGMSAVRVTGGAEFVMKNGSKIEDSDSTTVRTKSGVANTGEVGPAGAVWIQGSKFTMEEGAEISGVNGRAVYVDGGEAEIGGTITGIVANNAMWNGTNGTAIHLRGQAKAILTGTGELSDNTKATVFLDEATFITERGSFIKDGTGNAIQTAEDQPDWTYDNRNTVTINGNITGIKGNSGHAIQFKWGTLTIGETAHIYDNLVNNGTVYVQKKAKVYIYGKIDGNTATGKGGALRIGDHGYVEAYMYPGAEISHNSATDSVGAVYISNNNSQFTMLGGKIEANTAIKDYGGIYIRNGGKFIMQDGIITKNISGGIGGGVTMDASGTAARAQLNGGTITGNIMGMNKISNDFTITSTNYGKSDRYLFISDEMNIGNMAVYFQKENKTVIPAEDSLNIKLGNANNDKNTGSVAQLTSASTGRGWRVPLATFWTQRNGGATLTVALADSTEIASDLPVYVLTQKTNSEGTPIVDGDDKVYVYAATKNANGSVTFTIPDDNQEGNGCAVALVQPTQDYGTFTIDGPKSIKKSEPAENYPVNYTATYKPSTNLTSQGMGSTLTATIQLADGLTYVGGSLKSKNNNYNVTAAQSGNTLTVTLPAKDGKAGTEAKFAFQTTLAKEKFVANGKLVTSGTVSGSYGTEAVSEFEVPAVPAVTEMLPLNQYTVTFDSNGGSEVASQTVTEGDKVAKPDDPTRADYTFTGWYTARENGKTYDFTSEVNGNLTLYAHWSKKDSGSTGGGSGSTYYTLKYESNGGTEYKDERYASGSTVKLDKTPTREGYDFTGWYSDKGTTDRITSVKMNSNKTVYAGWKFSGDLNAENHVAYVHGYLDGTVGPNRNITRAETAVMLYRLLTEERSKEITTTSNSFSDVPASVWYSEAVSSMANGGYITGYSDGTFGGEKSITRAEFVTMMVRFISPAEGVNQFTDVPTTHWAYQFISTATAAGWISGYTDGSFGPEKPITRAEAMTIINRVLNRGVDKDSELLDFKVWPDNNPSDWFYYDVIEATNGHEYTGSRPSENWTKLIAQ